MRNFNQLLVSTEASLSVPIKTPICLATHLFYKKNKMEQPAMSIIVFMAALFYSLNSIEGQVIGSLPSSTVYSRNLPSYGLLQLQPAPEYSFGPLTTDILEVQGGLAMTGEAWSLEIETGASFLYAYKPEVYSRTLFTDPEAGPWVNQPEFNTLRYLGDLGFVYGTWQLMMLEPRPNLRGRSSMVLYHVDTTGRAVILDSVSRVGADSIGATIGQSVHIIDKDKSSIFAYATLESWARGIGLGQLTFWKYQVSDTAIRKTSEYVWEDVPFNEFPGATYIHGDTLFRVIKSYNDNVYYLQNHDLLTGVRIPETQGLRRRLTAILPNEGTGGLSYGTDAWFRDGLPVVSNGPHSLRAEATLLSVGYDGRERYRVASLPAEGYVTGPSWSTSVVDTAHHLALLASDNHAEGTSGRRTADDYSVLVEAFDEYTGESQWRTQLSLEGVEGPDSRYLAVFKIVPRPNGGYIVGAHAGALVTQPDSGLHRAYTALFFLDSLGCFSPGCREVNSVETSEVSYALTLAPNPVPAGTPVRLDFGSAAEASGTASARFRLTDAAGRVVKEGRVDAAAAVPTDDLVPGVYYLTVPVGHGSSGHPTKYATRVLIVE